MELLASATRDARMSTSLPFFTGSEWLKDLLQKSLLVREQHLNPDRDTFKISNIILKVEAFVSKHTFSGIGGKGFHFR